MIALFTWIWQGVLIAVATAAFLSFARGLGAAARHAIWCLALTGVLALPCAYALASFRAVAVTAPAALPIPAGPDWLSSVVLLVWLTLASAGILRIARSVLTVFRLKRAGVPIDPALESRLPGWGPAGAGRQRPQLRVCEEQAGACALGLGRPVVLVSRALVDALDADALAAIVAHERAHLERHDDWWQLLQAIVRTTAGWHPAVWYLARRIALEREAACDDEVVSLTGDARAYARALVEAAGAQASWPTSADRLAIPGAMGSASLLRRRVRRLLDGRTGRRTRVTTRTRLAAAGLVMGMMAGAANAPALFVIVDAAAAVPHVVPLTLTRVLPVAHPVVALVVGQRAGATTEAAMEPAPSGDVTAAPVAANSAIVAEPLTLARRAVARTPDAPVVTTGMARGRWGAVGHSATSSAHDLERAGVTTGRRARDSGLTIAGFFTRAGKRIAGGF